MQCSTSFCSSVSCITTSKHNTHVHSIQFKPHPLEIDWHIDDTSHCARMSSSSSTFSSSSSSSSSSSGGLAHAEDAIVPSRFRDKSLYEILAIPTDADDAQINRAFRSLALRCHPDRFQTTGGAVQAHEEFKFIALCRATLLNADRRREYDETGSVEEALQTEWSPRRTYTAAAAAEAAKNAVHSGRSRVTVDAIEAYRRVYQDSDEEMADLRRAWAKHGLELVDLFQHIPYADETQIDRLCRRLRKDSAECRKRLTRARIEAAKRAMHLVETHGSQLNEDDDSARSEDDSADLRELIDGDAFKEQDDDDEGIDEGLDKGKAQLQKQRRQQPPPFPPADLRRLRARASMHLFDEKKHAMQ